MGASLLLHLMALTIIIPVGLNLIIAGLIRKTLTETLISGGLTTILATIFFLLAGYLADFIDGRFYASLDKETREEKNLKTFLAFVITGDFFSVSIPLLVLIFVL